jgi:hypothetical protein
MYFVEFNIPAFSGTGTSASSHSSSSASAGGNGGSANAASSSQANAHLFGQGGSAKSWNVEFYKIHKTF